MDIIINTIEGTFVVQREKQADLLNWLKQNAVKVGQEPLKERYQDSSGAYSGRQLINENI
jgi:hypothetical protein